MSWKADCQSCDRSWIYDNPKLDTIKQCRDCVEKGYPARLIFSVAVEFGELKDEQAL